MALYSTLGQRHTGRSNAADVKTRDISSEIALYQPNLFPFYSLTAKMGAEPCKQMKFEYASDDDGPVAVTINASGGYTADASVVDFQLDTGMAKWVRVDSIWRGPDPDSEHMKVLVSNAATDVVRFSRNYGSFGLDAWVDNQSIYLVSEGFEEGGQYSDAVSRELVLDYNYCHDLEVPLEISDIQDATEDYTTDDWTHQEKMAARRYKLQREIMWWSGIRDLRNGVSRGKRIWTTGGVLPFIINGFDGYTGTSVNCGGGILTKKHLERLIIPTRQFGNPNTKMLWGPPGALAAVTNICEGTQEVARSEDTLGMDITKVKIAGVMVPLIEDQIFVKMGYTSTLVLVDMSLVKKRYLSTKKGNFNVRTIRNIQEKDRKGKKDVIRGVEGLQIKNPRAHGRIHNFTTVAN